ncbi:MAG: hypothetical protein LBT04_10280 [Prevotellaceae bacterium]|jgi:hypothetical protein|nr:hypothetical protein [Prevotellaceae bacterium]
MKKITILIIIVLAEFGYISAQVSIMTEKPTPNSALQVASPDKDRGLLLPKATQTTIDNLQIVTESGENENIVSYNADGLMIYNVNSGCFGYYNQAKNQWWNLCGTLPPAVSSIDNCGGIKVAGVYLEDEAFTLNNYLQVPVVVSVPGTYVIMATVVPDNGYYFMAQGTFPRAGGFTVTLNGAGTPNAAQTDIVKISINGKEQICEVPIVIGTKEPDYCIIDAQQNNPRWPVITDLTGINASVTATLMVYSPGEWKIITSEVNGYSFAGKGRLENAQGYNPAGKFPQTVKVVVPVANGQAAAYGTGKDHFTLSTASSKNPCNYGVDIQLSEGGFYIPCQLCPLVKLYKLTKADSVELKIGTAIPFDAYIDIPIHVTAPIANVTVRAQVAGLTFATADFVTDHYVEKTINLLTTDNSVRLYPTGNPMSSIKPTAYGQNLPIVFTTVNAGNPAKNYFETSDCKPTLDVKTSTARFSSVTLAGYTGGVAGQQGFYQVNSLLPGAAPNVIVTAIRLNVATSQAGQYSFSATANGITYSGSGEITATGTTEVTLTYSSDTPAGFGRGDYNFAYHKVGDTEGTPTGSLTVPVYFGYRSMKIVSYGDATYTMNRNPSNAKKIVEEPGNFGITGKIPSLGYTVTMYTVTPNATTMATQIKDADVVFINYPASFGATTLLSTLKAFNDAGGVVIYSSQSNTYSQNFYNTFYGGTITSDFSSALYYNIPIGTRTSSGLTGLPATDPIVYGPFTPTGFTPVSMMVESDNACYTDKQTLASTIIPLSRVTGNNHDYIFAWYDTTKGLMYFGDSGWTRGESSSQPINCDANNKPIASTNTTAAYTILSSNITEPAGYSHCSYIFANAVAWAMEYAAKHRVFAP